MSDKILSSVECKTILTRYLDGEKYELLDYSVGSLSDNIEGFMGEHLWLTINFKTKNDEHFKVFFMKREPVQFELMSAFSSQINAFNNEVFFYENIIPQFKKYNASFDDSSFPKFYFSRESSVIVLENLTEYNYRIADTNDVFDLDHIHILLQAMAKLHAGSIVYEERKSKELGRQYRLTDDGEEYLKETFFHRDENYLGYCFAVTSEECIQILIDAMPENLFTDISKEKFKKKYAQYADGCFTYAHPSNQFRNVLCHADMWRKNVMFKYEAGKPVHCKMLDFQLMKYGPPIYDVLKCLYQVTSSEIRQHHLDNIIEYYYNQLSKELKLENLNPEKVLPYDELIVSANQLLPYIMVEATYYYTFQKTPPEYFKEIMAHGEAYKEFVFKDRRMLIEKFYKPNTYFQKWLDELILEIKDFASHDGFSLPDCRTLLKNKLKTTNYELIKYNVKLLDEQNGFMGAHKKINVAINRNGFEEKLHFFAKFLPNTEFSTFAIESRAFDNEKFMYSQIFKSMEEFNIDIYDCVPKCFFSRKNDVLVFEDLNELGFHQINKHKALKLETVIVIIKTLAKYHAAFLIFEEKMSEKTGQQFRINHVFENDLQDVVYIKKEGHIGQKPIQSLIKGVKTHIDLFPDPKSTISDEDFKQKAAKIFTDLMYVYSEPSKKYRNVVCHGDLWASNILMKYEDRKPVHAKLVDFQCVKKCPPAQDLMAFIYLTTSRKFRSNYMTEVVNIYHTELGKCLKEYGYDVELIVPYNAFLESCEYYKTFAIAQTVSHFQFVMSSAEDMGKLFKDDKLCHKTFYVDRSEFILKMCERNAHYKVVLNECLVDFRILCETINL